jgi:hypothetical protein
MNYTMISLSKHVFLFFNELYHDYLIAKAYSMIYYVFFIKIVLFDYYGDLPYNLVISLNSGEIPHFTLFEYFAIVPIHCLVLDCYSFSFFFFLVRDLLYKLP